MKYTIIIPGRPVPKGRPRFGKNGNVYTPKRTQEYEQLVGWRAKQVIKEPLKGDVLLYIRVYVKSNVFPDLDNIAKSLMDGMNNVAYEDDKQIAILVVQRLRSNVERVELEIEELAKEVAE